ncbi:MAG: radical SAM protein [Bacteroidales bacterium]|nr:radical SAM protein [Bacteroidales bacterium]MDZ4205412.1 radical SAM protein [Bacteroidales bacterium]
MAGFLFQNIVFGPVRSRRFGISLGINLLPTDRKVCTFNCIYCECGLTGKGNGHVGDGFYDREIIRYHVQTKFAELQEQGIHPGNITFAGNGEPTLHPDFSAIIADTVEIRNRIFPKALITVLSNSTRLYDAAVREALLQADNNVLKLDAGTEEYYRLINRPLVRIALPDIVENLKLFRGNLIIQGLFLKGTLHGRYVNTASEENLVNWLKYIHEIAPRKVMIYTIDRATSEKGLEKLSRAELEAIATRVNALGIATEVYN